MIKRHITLIVLAWMSGVAYTAVAGDYEYEGSTLATTNGRAGGYGGVNGMCQLEFGAGSRMCTSKELIRSPGLNTDQFPTSWVAPIYGTYFQPKQGTIWYDIPSGLSFGTRQIDCQRWDSESSVRYGLVYGLSNFALSNCELALKSVACCVRVGTGQQGPLDVQIINQPILVEEVD